MKTFFWSLNLVSNSWRRRGAGVGGKPFVELAAVVELGDTPLSWGLLFSIFSFRNSIEEQALPDRSSPLGSAEIEDLW